MSQKGFEFLRSTRFNVKNVLKKVAISSLVGATVLGTLPTLGGVTHATALTANDGKVYLDDFYVKVDENYVYPQKPRGVVATTLPGGAKPMTIVAFSDYLDNAVYLGAGLQNAINFSKFKPQYENDPLRFRDLVFDTVDMKSSPKIYGSALGENGNSRNVYMLSVKSDMTAIPLLEPGQLEDPAGIDVGSNHELYVAGGSDHTIWKLTPNPDYGQTSITEESNDDSNSDNSIADTENSEVAEENNDPVVEPTTEETPATSEETPATGDEQSDNQSEMSASHEFSTLNTSNSDVNVQGAPASRYIAQKVITLGEDSVLSDVVYDGIGSLYVADIGLNRILKVDIQSSPVEETVLYDIELNGPQSISLDNSNHLYVADTYNNKVKIIDTVTKSKEEVTTSTGMYSLDLPTSVAVDKITGTVYVADNHRMRTISNRVIYEQKQDTQGKTWNVVKNVKDLQNIKYDLSANYVLANDISLEGVNTDQGGWVPIGGYAPFSGSFDGGKHTISGLTSNKTEERRNGLGLFEQLIEATVKNLYLTDANINGNSSLGILAGEAYDSTIKNVQVQGNVQGGRYLGLLVGESAGSTYINNKVTGRVGISAEIEEHDDDTRQLGGLIGSGSHETIQNNTVQAEVVGIYDSNDVGGLIGRLEESGVVRQNAVTGMVSGSASVGGLVGRLETDENTIVSDNYTWSNILVNNDSEYVDEEYFGSSIGGFIGELHSDWSDQTSEKTPLISKNYASNTVSRVKEHEVGNKSEVDPFVGDDRVLSQFEDWEDEGSIPEEKPLEVLFNDNFWNQEKFAGTDRTSNYATGLKDIDMKTQTTFTNKGWDFDNIWIMGESSNVSSYPVLRPYKDEDVTPIPDPDPNPTPVLAAPQNVQAFAQNAKAQLSWSSVADATGYDVYQFQGTAAPNDSSQWILIGENVPNAAYLATNLTNDKAYVFAVKSLRSNEKSTFSSASEQVTPKGPAQYEYEKKEINGVLWNVVKTPADLDHIRDDLTGKYVLNGNISKQDLNQYLQTQEQNSWTPIGHEKEGFSGSFDGGGHTIDGLKVDGEQMDLTEGGLFGYLNNATVRNIRLTNVQVAPSYTSGGLASEAVQSTIEKVAVEGTVRGSMYVGGLIGQLYDSTVSESYFQGKVSGHGLLGGLIGSINMNSGKGEHSISNNYAWATVMPDLPNLLARSMSTRSGGFTGEVNYQFSQPNGANVSVKPVVFKNNYSSSEVFALASVMNSEIIINNMDMFADAWPFEGPSFESDTARALSNYWDGTYIMPTNQTSELAKKLTTEQMKTKSSFEGWDFDKIWTLQTKDAKRGGYPTLKAFATEQVTPTPTPTPTPSTGGGSSAPIGTPAPTNTTTINVNVQNNTASNGLVVASLAITRTKGADGSLKDQLQFTSEKAKEIIDLLKTSGSKTAAIVLPDATDEVSEWTVNVPNDASNTLTSEGVELVILNPNVNIKVPASSLTDLTDDLYFRLTPVKSTTTSTEIQNRALSNPQIVASANGGNITVAGRPMTIETNLQSRPVTLTLPLAQIGILTAAQQRKLGVYIEHSDGTKELVRGTVVTQADGKLGLEITVNHFSTFTVVDVEKWGGSLNASPYIMGYADGSFKPAQAITRAELAAIVGRITGVTQGNATFSDVKNGSWAASVVGPVAASGIMTGYNDGTFKPNASITRGELAAALAKLLPQSGLEMSGSSAGFSDLAANHWVTEAAKQLQAASVVTGYANGSFKPEQKVTRAEAVTMINRLVGLGNSGATSGTWSDVASGYWAYDAVRAASMQR